ncbi:MAG: 3-methyl-2-oxobutanoate hydroxymethyltransferase [Myxococcota bacterium]|nr:3-methyl-2-oxobutanoate hydroxymethyltransferase [Myxococcota bacterium]
MDHPAISPGEGMTRHKITVRDIGKKYESGRKLTMITCYDAAFARIMDKAGPDMLLVGDSLGMVIQGRRNTLEVTLEEMAYHCRAVSRANPAAHLICDMPFMSYQISPEQALESAGFLIREGRGESVKLEGGEEVAESIARIVKAGIPVVGHLGLTPQSIHKFGGFVMQGRDEESAARIRRDALILQEAGAFLIVLEGIPATLAEDVTQSLRIPAVGIGAGPGCSGQVLVCYDMLGMDERFNPRFLKKYAALHEIIENAAKAYVSEVESGAFPGKENY